MKPSQSIHKRVRVVYEAFVPVQRESVVEESSSTVMAASGTEMVVFGFDRDLDWLPMSFVKPLGDDKVCGVCGLVPWAMHVLPCGHRLCSVCYRAVEKSHRCPLDKQAVDMKLVTRTTWGDVDLQALDVRCWNAKYGCPGRGSVRTMLPHLKTTCRYRTVRCRRCRAVVLHRRIAHHLSSDCENDLIAAGEQSPPEGQQRASDRIGATQAVVSQATFDADRNTSAASKDGLRDPFKRPSEPALHTKRHSSKQKVGGDENVSATAVEMVSAFLGSFAPPASAWSIEQPASTAVEATVTPTVSPAKKAKRQTLPESPVERDIGESRVVSPLPTLSFGKECCECTIENWSSFRSGQDRAVIRNGRCECNTNPSGYGFLLVPSVAVGFLCFTVHAFRDSRRTIVPFPREGNLNLRFVHPDGESSMDLTKAMEVSWDTCSFPLKKTPHQLHVARCRDFDVTIERLLEGGFVAHDRLRVRFKLS
ncbi:hypothetical protein MTO96_048101 [Rhipicephalus appendiculatus]